ncbi:MAG: hypothetical protein P1U68_05635 [Verrucomicrobiales bacterium]|nr:hypothetical protein [Verrucomicrobiales bacterium]
MKNISSITIVVIALSVVPFFTAAQEKGKGGKGRGGPPQPEFSEIDTDGSGGVDKAEWVVFQVKSALERADRSFSFLAGEDDEITEEELAEMSAFRGGPRPGGSGGAGGPGGGMEKGKGKSKGEKGKGEKGKGMEDTGKGVIPKRPEPAE